jgi:hypothetical protein
MKSQRILATLTIGALVCAGFSTAAAQSSNQPLVITPPALKDGSNSSRAPFPAKRQFDDVTPPDGNAIDQNVPPNTPATNIEPPINTPTVAVFAPVPGGTAVVATTTAPAAVVTTTEPVLTPTGRPTAVTTTGTTYYAPAASSGKPEVITPPALKDGSNSSRAPFPARRQFDDVKSPDGQALDKTVPPNTPATNIEPPIR